MISDIKWKKLTEWCETQLINVHTLVMPRKLPDISEKASTGKMSDEELNSEADHNEMIDDVMEYTRTIMEKDEKTKRSEDKRKQKSELTTEK